MKILYLGDVMGAVGVEVVEQLLPGLVQENSIDFVVAQAENVTDGKGMSQKDYERLQAAGVHGFTSGNHTLSRSDTVQLVEDEDSPVTRPANYPEGTTGKRFKVVETPHGKVVLISLLGAIVGKDADKPVDNPLKCVDEILNTLTNIDDLSAIIVNFHGDFSSEKVVMGHYLDGRVTAVIGDHWHVPTADARVLPAGTAHITDVGMCGALNSSLGVKYDSIITRWRDNIPVPNELETSGSRQLNAVLIETDQATNRANSITQIRAIIETN